MNNKKKFIFIFFGSGIAMFLIFYFLPIEIFEVRFVGSVAESEEYLTLPAFLGLDGALNEELSLANLEMRRVGAGYLFLCISLIGLPVMLAYRSIITKESRKKVEQDEPSGERG